MSTRKLAAPEDPRRPSREEIETVCVLHVVTEAGSAGCSFAKLAAGLGLADELATALEDATRPLVDAGYLEPLGGGVATTAAGREWLRRQLAGRVVE